LIKIDYDCSPPLARPGEFRFIRCSDFYPSTGGEQLRGFPCNWGALFSEYLVTGIKPAIKAVKK
jgi:hypothetical protein